MLIMHELVQTKQTGKNRLNDQKHAIRVINNKTHFNHAIELSKSHKILNIFKLNVFSISILM